MPPLREPIDRLSVVNVMTRTGPAPATELAAPDRRPAARLRGRPPSGATRPQWLVNRAADRHRPGPAVGDRSSPGPRPSGRRGPAGRRACPATTGPTDLAARPGGRRRPARVSARPSRPSACWPRSTSTPCSRAWWRARAGHDAAAHRQAMGGCFAPFTEVAADHPYAWFPEARTADDIATPAPDNRIVCEPYTKLMTAFLGSDQGAALVVCSLAAARRAGVADRAVFVWSGAEAADVRFPAARPDPGRSPAIAAAGRALLDAASSAAGPRSPGRHRRRRRPRPLLVLPLGGGAGRRRPGHRPRRPPGADRHRRAPLLRRARATTTPPTASPP